MLKNLLFSFCCFGSLLGFDLPSEFYVTEKCISFSRAFVIETDQQKLGSVYRRVFDLGTTYDFYDQEETLLASARMRWMSAGAIFDVVEFPHENPIGRVEEELFTWYPKFTIFSPSDEAVAVAAMNFWGTTYELRDPCSGELMATLQRSFFRFKDDWKVSVENRELFKAKKIDPRLFITMMAFQTDVDHWKAETTNCRIHLEAPEKVAPALVS